MVVMGTGEPLDNYDNLLRFIRMLSDEKGLHISQRNITVSTCGIVPRMYDLAQEDLQITLAISLHASNQQKREQLMPIARKYSLDELMKACRNYFEKTGRRLTFEYSLVGGENDSQEECRGAGSSDKRAELPRKSDPGEPYKRAKLRPVGQKSYREFSK